MSDLVRLDVLLGGPKTIVGNQYLDIILQTLGKLYVLSGSAFTEITSAINSASSAKPTIVMDSISMLDPADYTGLFLYETTTKRLYLSVAGAFCLIADTDNSAADDKYILKANPEVFKPITINTASAPLKVNSMNLVSKLNADLLDGIHGDAFAQKEANEEITGRWNFKKNTVFESPTRFYRNITIDESFGSPQFMSGYNGYGWRFDATSNTLTIDNLVVRKTMHVFELVVNKITATNGSLWITNAFKVDLVHNIHAIDITRLTTALLIELLNGNTYYVFYSDTFNKETITVPKKNICSNQSAASEDGVYDCFDKVFYVGNLANLTNTTSDIITFINGLSYTYLYNEFIPSTITDYGSVEINNRSYFTDLDITPTISVITSDHISYTLEHVPLFRLRYLYKMFPYFKYFAAPKDTFNYYIVIAKEDEYPVFKIGDMIRCLKFTRNTIKYYDAVVIGYFGEYGFIILVATSETMYTSTVETDEYGNPTIKTEKTADSLDLGFNEFTQEDLDAENANRSEENKLAQSAVSKNFNLAQPEEGDSLVQIGSIMDTSRMGSLYLTSTDDLAPFMDVITEVDRPDYSVLYFTPVIKDGDYVETSTGYYKAELSVKTKVRVGKLTGIHDEKFKDKQPHGYGLYGENVFLTGEFYLNNGDSVVEFSLNGIFERYKKAGLTILDVAGETDKEEILLEADQIKFTTFDEDGNPTQAGMFDKGKFNAKYIDVGNLNAENIIATEEGNAKDVNPVTHPDKTTDSTAADYLDPNDPASYVKNTTKPYVIINGHTGKLFAKDGVFLGEIIAKGSKNSYIHLNPNMLSTVKLPSMDVYNNYGMLSTSITGNEITLKPTLTSTYTTSSDYYSYVYKSNEVAVGKQNYGSVISINNLYYRLDPTLYYSFKKVYYITSPSISSKYLKISDLNDMPPGMIGTFTINKNFTISLKVNDELSIYSSLSANIGSAIASKQNQNKVYYDENTTGTIDENHGGCITVEYKEKINDPKYTQYAPVYRYTDGSEYWGFNLNYIATSKIDQSTTSSDIILYSDYLYDTTKDNDGLPDDLWSILKIEDALAIIRLRFPESEYDITFDDLENDTSSANSWDYWGISGIYDRGRGAIIYIDEHPIDSNYIPYIFQKLLIDEGLIQESADNVFLKNLSISLTLSPASFTVLNVGSRTEIGSNGINIYLNDDNYYRMYVSKDKLITSYKSEGRGMHFEGSKGYLLYSKGFKLTVPTPILRFKILPIANGNCTRFELSLWMPTIQDTQKIGSSYHSTTYNATYMAGNAAFSEYFLGTYWSNGVVKDQWIDIKDPVTIYSDNVKGGENKLPLTLLYISGGTGNNTIVRFTFAGENWRNIFNVSPTGLILHTTLYSYNTALTGVDYNAIVRNINVDSNSYTYIEFVIDTNLKIGLIGTIETAF